MRNLLICTISNALLSIIIFFIHLKFNSNDLKCGTISRIHSAVGDYEKCFERMHRVFSGCLEFGQLWIFHGIGHLTVRSNDRDWSNASMSLFQGDLIRTFNVSLRMNRFLFDYFFFPFILITFATNKIYFGYKLQA